MLIDAVKEKVDISDAEVEILTSSFQLIRKKKNAYLVKEGDASLHLYFILEGYVRCYYIDDAGNEITTHICGSNEFVTSFESFSYKVPSKANVQCTSDCVLLSITKEEHDGLYKSILNWTPFCQSVYEKQIVKISERAHTLQILSASERYLRLLHKQPQIAQNTSVKHLASYLGIKPQSLSRIRKEIK